MVTIYMHRRGQTEFFEVNENVNGTALRIGISNLDRLSMGHGETWLDRQDIDELWQALGSWLGKKI